MSLFDNFLKRFADIESIEEEQAKENSLEEIEELQKKDTAKDLEETNVDDPIFTEFNFKLKKYNKLLLNALYLNINSVDRKVLTNIIEFTDNLFSPLENIEFLKDDINEILKASNIYPERFFQKDDEFVYKIIEENNLKSYILNLLILASNEVSMHGRLNLQSYYDELINFIRVSIIDSKGGFSHSLVYETYSDIESIHIHQKEIEEYVKNLFTTDEELSKREEEIRHVAENKLNIFIDNYIKPGVGLILDVKKYKEYILTLLKLSTDISLKIKEHLQKDSQTKKDFSKYKYEQEIEFSYMKNLVSFHNDVNTFISSTYELLQTLMRSYLGSSYKQHIYYYITESIRHYVEDFNLNKISKDVFIKNVQDALAFNIIVSSLEHVFKLFTNLGKSSTSNRVYKLTYDDLQQVLNSYSRDGVKISRKNLRAALETVNKINSEYATAIQNILSIKEDIENISNTEFKQYLNDIPDTIKILEQYFEDITNFTNDILLPELSKVKNPNDDSNIEETVKFDQELIFGQQVLINIDNFLKTKIVPLRTILSKKFSDLTTLLAKI